MRDQPSTFRFNLWALFVCTTFVGLGLAALRYASPWGRCTADFALMGFVTYAFVAAVASTGSRRLFWAAFAASACVSLFVGLSLGPYRPSVWLWDVIRPAEHEAAAAIRSGQRAGADTQAFDAIFRDIFVIAVAIVAAYTIPWLVQRGQEPPASRVPTSP